MNELEPSIILGAKEGDEACWRQLFASCYPLAKWAITHTLYQIDDFTVNSLAQDTMIALVSGIKRINDAQFLKRFIVRVARNKCVDYIRSHQEQFDEVTDDLLVVTEEECVDEQTIAALHEAVNNLKEPCNFIIRQRFLEGVSYKELAKGLNVGISQIGIRISRCLGFLRKSLERMDIPWRNVL